MDLDMFGGSVQMLAASRAGIGTNWRMSCSRAALGVLQSVFDL
jgi:hypothetical protein